MFVDICFSIISTIKSMISEEKKTDNGQNTGRICINILIYVNINWFLNSSPIALTSKKAWRMTVDNGHIHSWQLEINFYFDFFNTSEAFKVIRSCIVAPFKSQLISLSAEIHLKRNFSRFL